MKRAAPSSRDDPAWGRLGNRDLQSAQDGVPTPDRAAGPIFIAGPDRSGTTLMYALLASHPNISMVRRTNMWRWFDGRYGDLAVPANLDRCLDQLLRYRRMRVLGPDREQIRREFLRGDATYARLFALFHEHHAERQGKGRWGDKSLHTELYVDRVFASFPDARVIHMVRDPRDRWASVRKRFGQDLSRVGSATGRWLSSTRAGRRAADLEPDRYRLVRYEDLARDPEQTVRSVCAFIGEPYAPEMLEMRGVSDPRARGANSSFGDVRPGTISTRAIGRFREVLTPGEIRFIQLFAGRHMDLLGYRRAACALHATQRIRYYAVSLPSQSTRLAAATVLARIERRRARVPVDRLEASWSGS